MHSGLNVSNGGLLGDYQNSFQSGIYLQNLRWEGSMGFLKQT